MRGWETRVTILILSHKPDKSGNYNLLPSRERGLISLRLVANRRSTLYFKACFKISTNSAGSCGAIATFFVREEFQEARLIFPKCQGFFLRNYREV